MGINVQPLRTILLLGPGSVIRSRFDRTSFDCSQMTFCVDDKWEYYHTTKALSDDLLFVGLKNRNRLSCHLDSVIR